MTAWHARGARLAAARADREPWAHTTAQAHGPRHAPTMGRKRGKQAQEVREVDVGDLPEDEGARSAGGKAKAKKDKGNKKGVGKADAVEPPPPTPSAPDSDASDSDESTPKRKTKRSKKDKRRAKRKGGREFDVGTNGQAGQAADEADPDGDADGDGDGDSDRKGNKPGVVVRFNTGGDSSKQIWVHKN